MLLRKALVFKITSEKETKKKKELNKILMIVKIIFF